jgi:hypothetical protein
MTLTTVLKLAASHGVALVTGSNTDKGRKRQACDCTYYATNAWKMRETGLLHGCAKAHPACKPVRHWDPRKVLQSK